MKPTRAWCAIPRTGEVDIDLIRRAPADCQHAAKNVTGIPWPRMAAEGWSVLPILIGPLEGDDKPAPSRLSAEPADRFGGPVSRHRAAPVEVRPSRDMAILKC